MQRTSRLIGRGLFLSVFLLGSLAVSWNRLEKGAAHDAPAWSPDGTKIAFASERDGNYEIYLMDADGSNPTKISNTAVSAFVTVARQQGVDEAIRRYRTARAAQPEEAFFLDAEVDLLAYERLDAGEVEDALKLFILNTEAFPNAEDVFLSLGDVQMRLKNKAEAIRAYEQALALNPDRAATVDQLQQARID